MPSPRTFVFAAIALFAVTPTSAHAAMDSTNIVSSLANESAELVDQEAILLAEVTDAAPTGSTEQARTQLQFVDSQASALLAQLRRLGIELSPAITTAMDPLPSAFYADQTSASLAPDALVYRSAAQDLRRIAATPSAALPASDSSTNESIGLLIVAAASLLVLGLAALTNTLQNEDDDELASLAWSDGLTGLANRRRLDHDLAEPDHHGPTAVIMVDVDHFKAVNDSHGHIEGDDILKRVSAMLADVVRHDDVVYRYGGEEFCILLPNATSEGAQMVADRIIDGAHQISLPDGPHLTVSAGIASGDAAELKSMIGRADEALFAAKRQGRDQVVDESSLTSDKALIAN